jgi:carboxyl-terminal processing protease
MDLLYLKVCFFLVLLGSLNSWALNPIQAEKKFNEAFTCIEERYIEPVQVGNLMRKGFMEVLALPTLSGRQYSDLVAPAQKLTNRKVAFEAFREALKNCRSLSTVISSASNAVDIVAESQETVIEPVDLDVIVSAMIRGMISSLRDDYSSYLEPAKTLELQQYLRGENQSFGGIGVHIQFKEGRCHVIRTLADTPAQKAGVLPGDIIQLVDGEPIPTEDIALDRIKGEPGTRIKLTIERSTVPEPLVYEVVREMIQQNGLERVLLANKVGYVRINSFNENTARDFERDMRFLDGYGMTSCILDLRQNYGGLLTSAVDVVNVLIPKGSLVVSTRGRIQANDKTYRTRRNLPFTRIPLVVLVDAQTASAAEIVTGAVRDNRRGKVVGVKTFGKGTVQEVIPLPDNSALKLTVARYYTPAGEMIDKRGITPDYEVKQNPTAVISLGNREPNDPVDLQTLTDDLQLKKALELLGVTIPTPGT